MRQMIASRLNSLFYKRDVSAADKYHAGYYNTGVWQRTTWMGVTTYKSPADMWNYQKILVALKASLIVEFGTAFGGSALFFASVMRQIGGHFKVFSVDITNERIDEKTKSDPDIELLTCSSSDPRVANKILALRGQYPGPMFATLTATIALHTSWRNLCFSARCLFLETMLSWKIQTSTVIR